MTALLATSAEPHAAASAEQVLAAARRLLQPVDADPSGLQLIGRPLLSRQSVVYFLGRRHGPPLYVAKLVSPDCVASPAARQFEALQACHRWWRGEGRHAVAEPLAMLPGGDGFLMRHVPGESLARVLPQAPIRRRAAASAATAAGDFLARFHRHGSAGTVDVQLADLAAAIHASQAVDLRPVGLSLPAAVERSITQVPRRSLKLRRVRLHGDFTPRNLIATGADEVAMIDPLLAAEGFAEDDVAAFLTMMSSASVFAGALLLPGIGAARVGLERAFLDGYGAGLSPVVLALRQIYEQMWRWAYRRRSRAGEGPSGAVRRRLIDGQMCALLEESAALLDEALAALPIGAARR